MRRIDSNLPRLFLFTGIFLLNVNTYLQAQPSLWESHLIIGGETTLINEVPWQAAISLSDSTDLSSSQFCGGAILDQIWILTTASCVIGFRPEELKVTVGVTSLSADSGYSSSITQIIIHPDFELGSFDHDIALLRMADPINPSFPNAEPIQFATMAEADSGLDRPGLTANISGWGWIDNEGTLPDSLQSVDVDIISLTRAQEGYEIALTERMLAAGDSVNGNADACVGDSGGPLTVFDSANEEHILIGLASFGSGAGCGLVDRPSIYTRVAFFEDWIREQTKIGLTAIPFAIRDIGIIEFRSSIDSTEVICSNDDSISLNFSTQLLIENAGLETITSFTLTFFARTALEEDTVLAVNNISLAEPLLSRASRMLDSISFNLPPRYSTFLVRASIPNELPDLNITNDTAFFDIVTQEGFPVTFVLQTDFNPQDNFWFIFKDDGDPFSELIHIGNNGNPYDLPETTFSETVCLPAGDYTFIIEDQNFDGISAPGGFDFFVSSDSGEFSILDDGEEFFFERTISFSLPFKPVFDGQLNLLTSLADTIISCDGSIPIIAQIQNNGNIPINASILSILSADSLLFQQTFSSSIFPGIREVIELSLVPPDSISDINILFEFVHESGSIILSDTISINRSFAISPPKKLVPAFLELQSDFFPEENSWRITDENGIILDGALTLGLPETNTIDSLCLNEGCYTFFIEDLAGDGLFQVQDSVVQVTLADTTEVFSIGPDFGFGAREPFCLLSTPTNLTVSMGDGVSGIMLNWNDESNLEEGYLIERTGPDSGTADIFFAPQNATQFIDTTSFTNTNVAYVVRAFLDPYVSAASNQATIEITTAHTSSISSEINIYPNPVEDVIVLEWNNTGTFVPQAIHIFSLWGQLRYTKPLLGTRSSTFDVSFLEKGYYLLKLDTNQGSFYQKILKN